MDFEEIYSEYVHDVYRYILSLCGNSHIAEDVTSETFVKGIKAIDKFKGECSMRVWLCQIAKNTYYNYVKRKKPLSETPEEPPSSACFELNYIDKSDAYEIHKILHLLDEPYKEIFSLRVFSELSFSEIGELFGKSESWARVTFYRAKNKIREAIKND
ncbi:MAG: RNA polymerase sigma factor [Peptococcaceae bacterium]|nr:RNA polymerase sigma factor [Peptococcaceae bacterium]